MLDFARINFVAVLSGLSELGVFLRASDSGPLLTQSSFLLYFLM